MTRKYNVLLDAEKVERLRDVARRRAVAMRKNTTWVDLLREAADRLLRDEAGEQDVVVVGGGR